MDATTISATANLFSASWAIDRQSETPIYEQIAERFINLIEAGRLEVGDRLPAERELSTVIGVSRMTARAALSTLAQRGMIDRDVGRGTFVARAKLEHSLSPLSGFTDMAHRQGVAPTARLRAVNELPAPESVAQRLRLTPDAAVYRIERLRFGDGEPLALEDTWLPVALFPALLDHDVRGSLYTLMRQVYDRPPSRAVERLEPRLAEAHEAQLLGITPGAPLMLLTRISYDASGTPVELSQDHYRGDRARFVVEVGTGPHH